MEGEGCLGVRTSSMRRLRLRRSPVPRRSKTKLSVRTFFRRRSKTSSVARLHMSEPAGGSRNGSFRVPHASYRSAPVASLFPEVVCTSCCSWALIVGTPLQELSPWAVASCRRCRQQQQQPGRDPPPPPTMCISTMMAAMTISSLSCTF